MARSSCIFGYYLFVIPDLWFDLWYVSINKLMWGHGLMKAVEKSSGDFESCVKRGEAYYFIGDYLNAIYDFDKV